MYCFQIVFKSKNQKNYLGEKEKLKFKQKQKNQTRSTGKVESKLLLVKRKEFRALFNNKKACHIVITI